MSLIQRRGAAAPTAARGTSASRFAYKARSAEEVKARANRPIGSREGVFVDGLEYFTPPAGDNSVRILPPTFDAAQHYGLDLTTHYSIGPDKSAFLCLNKMKGEACPLCEERSIAADAGEEGLAKHLRPRMRVAVWVIDRKNENKGPLVWSMPAGLDKDIVNCAVDQQTGAVLNVDDPSEKGYDVYFKRIGTDERTEYSGIQVARNPSPLHDDPAIADRWLNYVSEHPLDKVIQFRTYDEIKAAYAGTTVEQPKDNAAGAKVPARSERQPATSAAPKVPTRRATTAPQPAAQPAAAAAGTDPEKPSWADVHALSEADCEALIGEFQLPIPNDGEPGADKFQNLTGIQDWICEQLEIAPPAPAQSKTTGGSWKDRLKAARGG